MSRMGNQAGNPFESTGLRCAGCFERSMMGRAKRKRMRREGQ